jgi:glycosyltransferase involved in cell wall biosynthesis
VPEVSVVIPAHNAARWLGETLDSVRAQSFTDWECIVVDDGSTDGTRALVARHADEPRIRYLFQEKQERAAARNRGIAASSGPLVAFLDADDRWCPEKLAAQVSALRAAPAAGLCYTHARFVDVDGRPLPFRKPPRTIAGLVFPELMRGNVLVIASVVVRRACLDAVGAFDASLPVYGCEDWDLWLRLARRYPVVAVDEELVLYRRHPGNTGWEQVLASALAVIDKWYADPETARQAGISRAAVRALHYWYNAAAVESRAAALQLARRAWQESPGSIVSRSALAALAALVLPGAAMRALRRGHSPRSMRRSPSSMRKAGWW